MARKKKYDDEPDDLALGASETPEPEAEDEPDLPPDEPAAVVAEDPEQPPAGVAEQLKGEAPVEEELPEPGDEPEEKDKKPKRRGAGKVYTLQVRRNDAEWADVAHTTVTTHPDHRDRQQAAVGYTKAQAAQVREDWERAGYEVQLVEVDSEPEPVE